MAMLFAGVAAGVLGSRLLPPLLASTAASSRTRMGRDPFDLLISDHREITSLLDAMVAAPKEAIAQRGKLFLMLKRKLAKHAMAEEDVVYPMLHGPANDTENSVDLYDDHAHIKILMFQIEEKLMKGEDWAAPVATLRDLTREHIHEEENDIFPRLRAMMNEPQRSKISGQISREEALIL